MTEWPDEQTARLKELWADKRLTIPQIAKRLGKSRNAVANKASRIRLDRRGPASGACDWTDEQIATLTRLWLEGWSASKIAAQIAGATRNAVIGKVQRLRLPPRKTQVHFTSGTKPRNKPRKSRAKPKVVKMRPPVPKPEPFEFTAGTWEPLAWATPVTLEHVTGCRWPASDPFAPIGSVDLFCNCKPVEGKSYCPEHQARSTGKGTAGEKSAVSWVKNYAMKEAA